MEVKMNRLKFKGSDQFYTGEVTPIGRNKVSIEFVGGIPKGIDTSLIEAFTPGGVKFLELTGFTTEYRRVDASLVLSNDGSVLWVKSSRRSTRKSPGGCKSIQENEMCSICNATIIAGCDVTVAGSLEHFRLTTDDQLNLFGKQIQLMTGAERFEYHEDGNPCRYFSAEEMQKIITATMAYKTYHTTYCNALNMWIKNAETLEEVNSIYYGVEIPEAYQNEVLKDLIVKMGS